MGMRTFAKYENLAKLFWFIFRPIFVAAAKSTDTTIDDEMIKVADQIIKTDFRPLIEDQ